MAAENTSDAPAKPTAAGLYDAYLGGTHNTPLERETANRLRDVFPELELSAWANRGFHQRAARWLAEQGLRQFIDLGAGLPTQNNTHQVVQRVAPDAHVVYVDIDPRTARLGKELVADTANTAYINADLRRRDAVLGDPELSGLIDLERPVGLLATAVFHFVPDEDDPWGIAAGYMDALAPGSYLALSHVTADRQPARVVQAGQGVYRNADQMIYLRGRDQVEYFFTGLELVPPYEGAEAKVVFSGLWGCEDPAEADDDSARLFYVGVAKRP